MCVNMWTRGPRFRDSLSSVNHPDAGSSADVEDPLWVFTNGGYVEFVVEDEETDVVDDI